MNPVVKNGAFVLMLLLLLIITHMAFYPRYNVWSQELIGKAELARAESNRKIAVLEAQAKKDSATMLAAAEIERAKGVAEANKIIGSSLKGNEEYLRYLWIESIQSKDHSIIYVPTEAGLPLLEAGREVRQTQNEKSYPVQRVRRRLQAWNNN